MKLLYMSVAQFMYEETRTQQICNPVLMVDQYTGPGVKKIDQKLKVKGKPEWDISHEVFKGNISTQRMKGVCGGSG